MPAIWSSPIVFVALLLSAVALAILVSVLMDMQWQSRILSAQIRQLEQEALDLSSEVTEAQRAEEYFDKMLLGTHRLIARSKEKSWAPMLRTIATSAGPGIALHRVRINEEPEGSGEYAVEMAGTALGDQPGAVADRFLSHLRGDFAAQFQIVDDVRFQSMQPVAESSDAGVEFFIVTRVAVRPAVLIESQP